MMNAQHAETSEQPVHDAVGQEIARLLGLVKRLEHENASLRRALEARPLPA